MAASGVVRVGTSGWSYKDWDGAFYPPDLAKGRWFEYYASRYCTVELNATFYRLPRPSTVDSWRNQSPPGFQFAVKGSRYLTHLKKLRDPEEPIATITGRIQPLRDTLGVWLWQLPGTVHRDVPRLERFLAGLPASTRHAVEFRHTSWYEEEVEDLLRRYGVAWVWLSDRQMPAVAPITADFVYLRFHGLDEDPARRYRWDYREEELQPWVDRLVAAARDGRDGWAYFNNDFHAHAPRNADTLVEMLGAVACPWGDAGEATAARMPAVRVRGA